jgi:hypothetical protein
VVGGLVKDDIFSTTVPLKLETKMFLKMIWLLLISKVTPVFTVPLREQLVTKAATESVAETEEGKVRVRIDPAGKVRAESSVMVAAPVICTKLESGAIVKALRVPEVAV